MPRDPEHAANLYLEAAKRGNLYSQARLAWIYEHGIGRRQDLAQSLAWNRLAAQRGYPPALNNLGYLYEHGLGVGRDLPEAAKLYCQAAASKLPEAQQNWAMIHAKIAGLPEDCDEAARWLARAAPQEVGNTSESIAADPKVPAGGSAMAYEVDVIPEATRTSITTPGRAQRSEHKGD